jgi:hypothetical protein
MTDRTRDPFDLLDLLGRFAAALRPSWVGSSWSLVIASCMAGFAAWGLLSKLLGLLPEPVGVAAALVYWLIGWRFWPRRFHPARSATKIAGHDKRPDPTRTRGGRNERAHQVTGRRRWGGWCVGCQAQQVPLSDVIGLCDRCRAAPQLAPLTLSVDEREAWH